MSGILIDQFLSEFNAEVPATKKCLERVPEKLYAWKPHETSMAMGYLVLLVADIPRWILEMIRTREINFGTFGKKEASTTAAIVELLDENVKQVRKEFTGLAPEDLARHFILRDGDTILINSPLGDNISSTLNHWVHHRGQLTVYMRMNGIEIPSIYGPSGDEKGF